MNVNFAVGPSIDGKKFVGPPEPLSTNGQAKLTSCDDNTYCTHMRKIPLGSIVELSMTAYNTFAAGNFYHPMHIHGFELYIMARVLILVTGQLYKSGPFQMENPSYSFRSW